MFDRSVSQTRDPRGRTAGRESVLCSSRGSQARGQRPELSSPKDLGSPDQVCLFRLRHGSAMPDTPQRPRWRRCAPVKGCLRVRHSGCLPSNLLPRQTARFREKGQGLPSIYLGRSPKTDRPALCANSRLSRATDKRTFAVARCRQVDPKLTRRLRLLRSLPCRNLRL